ncbi:MAG: hypothetical protein GY945_07120 [Rhodobacteraceae bacterium]|nr:hypothetical protein [Paracoccaceae bacterium]
MTWHPIDQGMHATDPHAHGQIGGRAEAIGRASCSAQLHMSSRATSNDITI